MNIHVWKGPAGGEVLDGGCSVKGFIILKMNTLKTEGTITMIDHFEHGIVFKESWEATKKGEDSEWEVFSKGNKNSFIDPESEEVLFTLNDKVNRAMKDFIVERIEVFLETGQKKIGPIKMFWRDRVLAIKEGKLFRVGSSFIFAAQIPDYLVGCSGSRCSNCGYGVAYCDQRCPWCGFPFVGPTGFPQIKEWKFLDLDYKKELAKKVFGYIDHGRLGYANVDFVPLTPKELQAIELLEGEKVKFFQLTHRIHPREIGHTLFYK